MNTGVLKRPEDISDCRARYTSIHLHVCDDKLNGNAPGVVDTDDDRTYFHDYYLCLRKKYPSVVVLDGNEEKAPAAHR